MKLLTAAVVLVSALTLSGCGGDKYSEPYQDAKRSEVTNTADAETGTMPDGFSNYATKCDRKGIRVYVLFHSDNPFGSISTIADPSCK